MTWSFLDSWHHSHMTFIGVMMSKTALLTHNTHIYSRDKNKTKAQCCKIWITTPKSICNCSRTQFVFNAKRGLVSNPISHTRSPQDSERQRQRGRERVGERVGEREGERGREKGEGGERRERWGEERERSLTAATELVPSFLAASAGTSGVFSGSGSGRCHSGSMVFSSSQTSCRWPCLWEDQASQLNLLRSTQASHLCKVYKPWCPNATTFACSCDNSFRPYNNNNVHLSCAHQRPECSHDTY